MNWLVTPLVDYDERAVALLRGTSFDLQAELTRSFSRVWSARSDVHAAPSALLIVWQIADEFEVQMLITAPAARRKGAARALLAELLASAERGHIQAIILEVAEHNHAAQALYRSFGFECEARRESYYSDGQAALVMRYRAP